MKWVPYTAVAAGTAILISSAITFATDGDEPAVSVALYLGGIALAIAAAIGFGLSRDGGRGRRALVAVGGTVLVVAWVMGLGDLLTPLVEVFSKKAYYGDEIPGDVLALVLLALGARAGMTSREPLPA